MAILATMANPNFFSTLPSTPPPSSQTSVPKPPIPVPKYPPPRKFQDNRRQPPPDSPVNPSLSPAFKTHHRNSKYYKPIKPGDKIPLDDADERAIVIGESGVSYQLPGAPFEFMYSYSEVPQAQPLAMREPAFLPFAPPTMPRPWTGKAPMKKSKRKIKLFEPLGGSGSDENGNAGKRKYEMLRNYELGKVSVRPREEVLGEPLTRWEIKEMLKPCLSSNKQVNLGRDGLTHNMLELIHSHWRRQPVCKVRCLGVPTVDMDNICYRLEEKAGGKIIYRIGGVVYLFRGRNYNYSKRPHLPLMLWKPAAPVYPKLIQEVPEGLTKEEAVALREKGKNLLPICKLAKNGVYISLVRDVRTAFEGSVLVKIDCRGAHASDYKKLGGKLKELVPCVLLSFDDEQILMWRGKDWKSMYGDCAPSINLSREIPGDKSVSSSPKMTSRWQHAVVSGKALVLDEIDLSPDELLSKVEKFQLKSQPMEHSYPAIIRSSTESSVTSSNARLEEDTEYYSYIEDDDFKEEVSHMNMLVSPVENPVPLGSLPIDSIAKKLIDNDE